MHMGTIDILDVRRGCIVVQEDEPAFAAACADLLGNPTQREQLGREAKAYAATWAAQEMAVRLAHLYCSTSARIPDPRSSAEWIAPRHDSRS
jgi:hypothetical protein